MGWFGKRKQRNRRRVTPPRETLAARTGRGRKSGRGTLRTALALPHPAVKEKLRTLAAVVLLAAGTALALGAGVQMRSFYRDGTYWNVREVTFSGQAKVNENVLRDTWSRFLATVALPATPRIFDVDLDLLRAFYLGQLTSLREVTVVRRLPDRLAIVVEERRPVALVRTGATVTYQVDRDGVVFAIVDPQDCRYPALTGLDPAKLVLGQASDEPSLRAALGLLGGLDRSWSERISEVQVVSPQELTAWVDGYKVVLGDGGYREKFTVLNGILQQLNGRRVKYIDLHSATRPAVMPLG